MNVTGKITAYMPPKSGVNSSGKQWTMQDVVVTWEEESRTHTFFNQNCIATLSGKVNQDMLHALIDKGTTIVVRIYFDVRIYNDRIFASNRAYLPDEYYEKE